MSDRGLAVLLVSAVLAMGLGLVLFIGAAGGARGDRPGDGDPRVFFGDRPPPAARTIGQVQERVPGAVRGLVPVQRQVASASREAAGYLLTLLFVGSALVFARGPVIAAYRATHGGWRAQVRVLALGGALLAVMTSAIVLLFISMLGAVAAPSAGALAARGFALGVGPLLQIGVTAIGVQVVGLDHIVVVAMSASDHAVRLHVDIGSRFPALISATGRCIAAFGSWSRPSIACGSSTCRGSATSRRTGWPTPASRRGSSRAVPAAEPRRAVGSSGTVGGGGARRAAAAVPGTVEESPDSTGQDAGESARRGDPRQVQQRADRLSLRATAGR